MLQYEPGELSDPSNLRSRLRFEEFGAARGFQLTFARSQQLISPEGVIVQAYRKVRLLYYFPTTFFLLLYYTSKLILGRLVSLSPTPLGSPRTHSA